MTKIFHLTLFNLPHLTTSTLIWIWILKFKACVFYFLYILSKAFQKLRKMIFISSKKLFLFLVYWIFCQFFPFLSTVSRFKGSDQKLNFSEHVFQLKGRLVTSFTPFLFFMILSIMGTGCKGKKQIFSCLTFSCSLLKYFLYGLF